MLSRHFPALLKPPFPGSFSSRNLVPYRRRLKPPSRRVSLPHFLAPLLHPRQPSLLPVLHRLPLAWSLLLRLCFTTFTRGGNCALSQLSTAGHVHYWLCQFSDTSASANSTTIARSLLASAIVPRSVQYHPPRSLLVLRFVNHFPQKPHLRLLLLGQLLQPCNPPDFLPSLDSTQRFILYSLWTLSFHLKFCINSISSNSASPPYIIHNDESGALAFLSCATKSVAAVLALHSERFIQVDLPKPKPKLSPSLLAFLHLQVSTKFRQFVAHGLDGTLHRISMNKNGSAVYEAMNYADTVVCHVTRYQDGSFTFDNLSNHSQPPQGLPSFPPSSPPASHSWSSSFSTHTVKNRCIWCDSFGQRLFQWLHVHTAL